MVSRNKYLRLTGGDIRSSSLWLTFLGKTSVNQNECVTICWIVADGSVGPKLKLGTGARYIVVHAGGEDGYVHGTMLFLR